MKNKVFFRRVSSRGQDLEMQISADAPFREQYLSKEIVIIDEYAVSANKLKISARPQMMKLVWMILNNKVDTIYAYDRSRLFRDFYESTYFVSICRKHNVRIIYTSAGKGHQQATDNTLIEGVLHIVGDIEGKNIARRTEEARRRFPPQKTGYLKQKETRQYIKDPAKEEILKSYFNDLFTIESLVELEIILRKYKKQLSIPIDSLLNIAGDPFYAAFDLVGGKNRLDHVTPYLTLSQYERLQEKGTLISIYKERKTTLMEKNLYQPYCGHCQKPMNFRYDISANNAWYTCSRKHPKNMILVDDLCSVLNLTLENIITKLDIDSLMKDSKIYFQTFKKPIETDLKCLKRDKDFITKEIIIQNDDLKNWNKHPQYQELLKIERTMEQSYSVIEAAEQLLLENRQIVNFIKEYLTQSKDSNSFLLYSMLVQKLTILPNEVDIEIKKSDYVCDMQEILIYEEELVCHA